MTELEELQSSNHKLWEYVVHLQEQLLRMQDAIIQLQRLQLQSSTSDNP